MIIRSASEDGRWHNESHPATQDVRADPQLEYLTTVLDEGTFTRAVARLHIAQSGVSHHIGKLERELQVQLHRRERAQVLPTLAGEAFAARA